MAVLNNSAAITALLMSSTSAHHTGAGRKYANTATTATRIIRCVRTLRSAPIAWPSPASANFRRVAKDWFFKSFKWFPGAPPKAYRAALY